jgi:menaquinol-cytochrome c reductase iron-sulfur subunit
MSHDTPDKPPEDEPQPTSPSSPPGLPSLPPFASEADATETAIKHSLPPPPTDPNLIARRQLLGKMSVGLGAAGGVALGVPMVGFVVGPLLHPAAHEWRAVGKVDAFVIGETVAVTFPDASPLPWAGVTGKTAAWLRRVNEKRFQAFSIHCAHLGCPVRWLSEARLFMCPCHGGVYYQDGTVAAGPPPHPLPQYPVRLQDGNVEILTVPIPID